MTLVICQSKEHYTDEKNHSENLAKQITSLKLDK